MGEVGATRCFESRALETGRRYRDSAFMGYGLLHSRGGSGGSFASRRISGTRKCQETRKVFDEKAHAKGARVT